ncbi:MAG: LysM peptidoglycan-binding domain-containing protein [Bacteroidales bacterium]|nr:LysM peptidoglycan-binding domain-containing protein [Bacteroidales bacterium]
MTYLLQTLTFLILIPLTAFPVEDSIKESIIQHKYEFIEYDSNDLYKPGALKVFFDKLDSLENGSIRKLSILHIGDSHIQADFFTGQIRKAFWKKFGNGGRGLVFPYKIARTNGPSGLDMFSNATWEVKRNVFPEISMRTGISGIGIRTGSRHAILKTGLKPEDSIPCYFDRITVFTPGSNDQYDLMVTTHPERDVLERTFIQYSDEYYTIRNGDYLGKIAANSGASVAKLKEWNNLKSDRIIAGDKLIVKRVKHPAESLNLSSFTIRDTLITAGNTAGCTFRFLSPVEFCFLHAVAGSETQRSITIQGILLESVDSTGIIYSMSGVNGAKFRHYNLSEDFFSQTGSLDPDLVIVSLGTNETRDASFAGESADDEISRFIGSLKASCIHAAILFTTPPDNLVKRKYHNKKCREIRHLIYRAADADTCAVWDLYSIMGGEGSMSQWKKAGLGRPDGIHFTREGYEVQADLLFDALLKSYYNRNEHEPE